MLPSRLVEGESEFVGDYDQGALKAALSPEQYADFSAWFDGQTGAIDRAGRMVVYCYDVERWASGYLHRSSREKGQKGS